MKAKSDIDIPRECLPPNSGTTQLLGARLIRLNGFPVAAITYKVGEDFAAMLVAGTMRFSAGPVKAATPYRRWVMPGISEASRWTWASRLYGCPGGYERPAESLRSLPCRSQRTGGFELITCANGAASFRRPRPARCGNILGPWCRSRRKSPWSIRRILKVRGHMKKYGKFGGL